MMHDSDEPFTSTKSSGAVAGGKIYGALIDAKRRVGAIGKDKETEFGQKYTYRSFDAVINAVGPLLDEFGIAVVPQVLRKETWNQQSNQGKSTHYCSLEVQYTFFASDGSSVVSSVVGQAMDSGDKSATKCMTVAYRIALCQVFNIFYDEMVDPEKGQQSDFVDNAKTIARFVTDLAKCKDKDLLLKMSNGAIRCLKGLHPTDHLTDVEYVSLIPAFVDAAPRCGADIVRVKNHLNQALGRAPDDVSAADGNGFASEPVRHREIDLMLTNAADQSARETAIVQLIDSFLAGHVPGAEFAGLMDGHFSQIAADDLAGYYMGAIFNSNDTSRLGTVLSLGEARQQSKLGDKVGGALQRYGQSLVNGGAESDG
jgi:hypothetical protein